MAFFKHRSWYVIRRLEVFYGLWPYQAWYKNYLIRIIFILLMLSGILPVMARLQKEWGVNLAIATENISGIMLIGGIFVKMIVACVFNEKRRKLYEKINGHFRTITDPQQAYALSRFTERGMLSCIKYLVLHGAVFAVFFCSPIVKMLLLYLMKIGELEKIIPYYTDYSFIIDEDKYYALILLQIMSVSISYAGMNCTCDFVFIMCVTHVRALFEMVKIHLQGASRFLEEYEWQMLDFKTANGKAYEFVKKAIDLHNEAFEIVSLIEGAYNFTLCVVLLEGLFLFCGGIYIVLFNLNMPFQLFRYIVFFMALFIHLCIQFLHGQLIIDSSSMVFDACCNFKLYLACAKTKTLVSIMMLRSSRPCFITGGGFFTISLETYGKMMKAGLSYLSIFTQRMNY